MKRDQLAHILRAAAVVADDNEVIVVGSQAIPGSYDEDDLPEPAHASIEADVFFDHDPELHKSDMVDGVLGEGSAFHEMNGYYAQGVDVTTATLPDRWRADGCVLTSSRERCDWALFGAARSCPFQAGRRTYEGLRVRRGPARR